MFCQDSYWKPKLTAGHGCRAVKGRSGPLMYSWMRPIKGRFIHLIGQEPFFSIYLGINCPQPHFPSRPPYLPPFKASLTLYILCLMNPFILQTFANNSHVVHFLILSVNLPRQSFTINYLDIGWCNQKWQTLTHCFLPQFDHIITLDLTESMGLKVLRLDFDNSWLFRFQFFSIPLLTIQIFHFSNPA